LDEDATEAPTMMHNPSTDAKYEPRAVVPTDIKRGTVFMLEVRCACAPFAPLTLQALCILRMKF